MLTVGIIDEGPVHVELHLVFVLVSGEVLPREILRVEVRIRELLVLLTAYPQQ